MTYNLSSKDHHLQNDMTPFFSANLVQVSESQTKCWCKKTMKLSQKQAEVMWETKLHKYHYWNKPGAIRENGTWFAQGY